MSTNVSTRLDPNWRWRTGEGHFLQPKEMETRHLFMILKMIWNNTMPAYVRVGHVKLYDFTPTYFYTRQYMKQAIYNIAWELGQRTLENWQVELLDEMAMHLTQYPRLMEDDDETEA
jgi:hypothetical protein